MKEANREVLDRGSLPELLLHRARHTSDRRLVLDAALGLTIAVLAAVLRPPFWLPFMSLALSLGAYGIWGILDREITDIDRSTRRAKVLLFARAAVGVAGGAVAVLSGVSVFFGLLGTWIS